MTALPPAAREVVAGLAAVFAGVVGACSLTPIVRGYTFDGSWPLAEWVSLQASATTLGAAVAVPVCVLLATGGSRRNAWLVAAACVCVIGVLSAWTPAAAVYYFARALLAGALLGAATAAAWGRQIAQTGLVVGFVGTWLIVWEREAGEPVSGFAGHVPVWLAAVAAVTGGLAAYVAAAGFRAARPALDPARVAIAGIIGYAVLNRLLGAWVVRADDESLWAVEIAVAALVVAVVAVITQFAPAADARFVLVLVAVTAAATPVVYTAVTIVDGFTVGVAVVVGLLATVLGVRVAGAAPHRLAGLGIVAVVTLVPVLWPTFGDSDSWIVVRVALLALGAGHAIGSNLPSESSYAAFGLVVPASSYAIATMYAVHVHLPVPIPPDVDVVMWTLGDDSEPDRSLAGLVMLALVLCCAALIALRSRRAGVAA